MRIVRKLILLFSLFLLVLTTQAQIIIQPAVPRLGIIQKTQLWNLLVINTYAEEAEIRIDLVLQDRQTGHTLLTAQSGTLKVSKGARQLNEQGVFPVQYKYESIFSNYNQQALLPVGNYLACYTIIRLPKQEPAGQECVAIDVTPLSPPMLIYPANGSVIVERNPQLSWIPPTPATLFSQLRYDILVTELYSGQSPDEAVQRNTPLFAMGNIPQQSMAYPASAASLDTGKVYAWQIIAKNGESYAAKSDVWTFHMLKELPEKLQSSLPYIKMSSEPSTPSIIENGILKLEYDHKTKDSIINLSIKNIKTGNVVIKNFRLKVKYGQNFLICNLSNYAHLNEDDCYEARISSSNNEFQSIKFYSKKSSN